MEFKVIGLCESQLTTETAAGMKDHEEFFTSILHTYYYSWSAVGGGGGALTEQSSVRMCPW